MIHLLASSNPLDHVVQHTWVTREVDLPLLGRTTLTMMSDQICMQLAAALLTILVVLKAARYKKDGDEIQRFTPRGGLSNFVEVICEHLRKNVALPSLGVYTDQFMPYLWTVFFFILFTNLLGLLPTAPVSLFVPGVKDFTHGHGIGGTATGNVWVTATLAGCTLIMIVFNGLRLQGMSFVKHFFMGPPFIAPLIAFLEVIGLIAKTFALTMRLFANMIAGHILLAVLLSFIAMAAGGLGTGGGLAIGIVVVIGSVAINMLELFVAFLQAFIFTFLTAMFIGQAVNIHHHDEHGHDDHGHEHEQSHAVR